ncbi:MAG: hypothetical protein WD424_03315 [Paenibacillaceae bacterium]
MIVRKIIFIVAIISALGISTVAAEEAEPTVPKESHDSHQGIISQHDKESLSDANQGEHESGQSEQGHHKEVVETPPNFMVLGSFAVVNLLFIMIGVWMKWFHKKGATA